MKNKVLMVGPVPPPEGGIASVVRDIMNSELREEYAMDLFERSASDAVVSAGFLGRNWFRVRRFVRFLGMLRKGGYTVAHIHSADPAFPGTIVFMMLARAAGVKALLHMHGTDWDDFYGEAPAVRRLVVRGGLGMASAIVVLYREWADEIRKLLPRVPVRVVGNLAHDEEPPDPRAVDALRRRLGLSNKDFVVVAVGSVGKRKGSFEILRAVPRVMKVEPSVRFILVGGEENPGEMAQLTGIVEREGLNTFVRLTGEVKREEVGCYLSLADLFLLPSFVEGAPISIIEALRRGTPVISTRVGGIPEMVEDGVTGILIGRGEPGEIADAVLKLKADAELRLRLGAEGRRSFEQRFEFSRGMDRLRELYDML